MCIAEAVRLDWWTIALVLVDRCVCDVCVRSGGRERKADEIQPYDVRGRSVGVGETRPTRLAAREPKIKFKMHHDPCKAVTRSA